MRWYIPTFHGDIALERHGDITLVKVEKLVPSEIVALDKLRAHALKKGWVREQEGVGYRESATAFPNPSAELTATIFLAADIGEVAKMLSGDLKPDRKGLSVVRYADGKMEEITDAVYAKAIEKGRSAATVATPVKGCPLPEFEQQEVRARRVLAEFLTAEQLADFKRDQAFVSVGADTGHRYMLVSRHVSRERYESYRSLFDVEEQEAFCIHDWTVPAAEELLSLHLHLQVPGGETYMRGVPADQHI